MIHQQQQVHRRRPDAKTYNSIPNSKKMAQYNTTDKITTLQPAAEPLTKLFVSYAHAHRLVLTAYIPCIATKVFGAAAHY